MRQTLSALGSTPWMIPGRALTTGLGLGLTFGFGSNMTVTVQHTFDVPDTPRSVALTRSGTSLTVTDTGHGLSLGDNVIISGDPNNIWNGSYDVASVTDANNYVVSVSNSGVTTSSGAVQSFRVFPHAIMAGVTGSPPANIDGNYAFAISACRLKSTAYTAGAATLTVLQAFGT